ncbi:MAG: hypothetical protein NT086_18985 [Proteobacteria bacterium]|nr:hypothetical protein [Pseudomonadota bacterium]
MQARQINTLLAFLYPQAALPLGRLNPKFGNTILNAAYFAL